MNPSIHHVANAYSNVNITTDVASASPHKLILLLFEGALSAIWSARNSMEKGNISGKVSGISKAMDIIGELNDCLDHDVGGAIALNLALLYDYCTRRLAHANLSNEVNPLNEVGDLLSGLRDTWSAIQTQVDESVAKGP